MEFKKWDKFEKILFSLLAIVPILGLTIVILFWYDIMQLLVGVTISGVGFILIFDLMINVVGINRQNDENNRYTNQNCSNFLLNISKIESEEKQVIKT
ncbi:MAG: hypothetical protein EAX96_19540 [Candidatus Lokiarchaeota archaeon]|nr:hypothetical protein [Candidatus Lokiarchaeota archaeon]